ncbi:MAG: hypothetical protein ACOC1I_08670, partial [Spirochaetota bacterium]
MTTSLHARSARRIAMVLLFLGVALSGWSQQLTTVAVFDLDRVLLNFYQDSEAVRDYREAERQFR